MNKKKDEKFPWTGNPSIEMPKGTGTKTVDISGMDRLRERYGYEWGCQVIMFRTLRWLRGHPEETPQFSKLANVVGVMFNENPAADDLEKFALDHPKLREYGATGAMVTYAIGHALKRYRVGDDAYFLDEVEERDGVARIFWFDESEAFPEDCNDGKREA